MPRRNAAPAGAARRTKANAVEPIAAAARQRRDLTIRPVRRSDLEAVIAIDAQVTGIEKRDYWRSIYRRYGESTVPGAQFLVAESAGEVVGFAIGEVRDWEFGAPPCGWVFAIDVRPDARLAPASARGCSRRSVRVFAAPAYARFERCSPATTR